MEADHLLSGRCAGLLKRFCRPFPGRKIALLQIGAPCGGFTQEFIRAGFDVTVLDSSPTRLGELRRHAGDAAVYRTGSPALLPFEDREFDCTVLMFPGCGDAASVPGVADVLREASRVAGGGMFLLEVNALCAERGIRRGIWDECPDGPLFGRLSGSPVFPWNTLRLLKKAVPGGRLVLASAFRTLPFSSRMQAGIRGSFIGRACEVAASLPFGPVLVAGSRWRGVPLTPSGLLEKAGAVLGTHPACTGGALDGASCASGTGRNGGTLP